MSTRKLKPKAKRKAVDLDEHPHMVPFHNPTRCGIIQNNVSAWKEVNNPLSECRCGWHCPIVETVAPPVKKTKTQTQSAKLLEDFGGHFDELASILLESEVDKLADQPCLRGRSGMIATTQCYDCTGYEMSCRACFVDAHMQNPFPWAEVWDTLQGFFVGMYEKRKRKPSNCIAD
ncbi:hypothetical protein B0H14DRAFT_2586509 [Mycena olivaceomarginata]|nr:hypothetical protein B0H14DRAFT_2586509 [Mycena olivaceomarginata]